MTLTPIFQQRSFQASLALPRVTWQPQRLSWRAVGGPDRAELGAQGDATSLWDLISFLRCPVAFQTDEGEAVWWGFVAEVEVQVDAIQVAVSVDTMANRVAVAYAYTSPTNTIGTRATTAYVEDADSVAEYGTFERLEASHTDDTSTAAALRDSVLAAYKYPVPQITVSPGARGVRATLHCRGWWDTLSRRLYDNAGTDAVETTEQIEDIIAAAGEFVTAIDLVDASGVSSLEYRDGDTNAQAEIEKLLERGSASGLRMLAEVTRERVLRIHEEPASGSEDLLLSSDGTLRDRFGALMLPGESPAGKWARLQDVIPATANTDYLADAGKIFIESAEWDETKGRFSRLEPRGPSVFDVSRLDPV